MDKGENRQPFSLKRVPTKLWFELAEQGFCYVYKSIYIYILETKFKISFVILPLNIG